MREIKIPDSIFNSYKIAKFISLIGRESEKRKSCAFNGWTPLYFATKHGHFSICNLIINEDEDKNPRIFVFGWTTIHCAALNGHLSNNYG